MLFRISLKRTKPPGTVDGSWIAGPPMCIA
jgi:hypothetical protein